MRTTDESAYEVEKSFYDFADDIEAVTIHFAVTPLGEHPDWENQRSSRFMPPVAAPGGQGGRLRVRRLRLPPQIRIESGRLTGHYLLHHYFEICQGGSRHYSPRFTEEIETGA
jgi:hypothetical protein